MTFSVPIQCLKPGDRFKCVAGHVYIGHLISVDENGAAATVEVKALDQDYTKEFTTAFGEHVSFATGCERLQWSCSTLVTPT